MPMRTLNWRAGGASVPGGVTLLAAITAAGESSRMGQPKALLPWCEASLLALMVETLWHAGLPRPAVIVGADAESVAQEARRWGALPVQNPDYRKGRFASVRVAAQWALAQPTAPGGRTALLLWPVDCPAVTVTTILALRRASAMHHDANLVPAFDGHAGHPIVLCTQTLTQIAAAPDETNLRDLLEHAPEGRLTLTVDDPAVLDNLNTLADYRACRQARVRVLTHVD